MEMLRKRELFPTKDLGHRRAFLSFHIFVAVTIPERTDKLVIFFELYLWCFVLHELSMNDYLLSFTIISYHLY